MYERPVQRLQQERTERGTARHRQMETDDVQTMPGMSVLVS